jgi:hypothetical protein
MENFRLKVFRTVADNLNFRQAAEALYRTHQPNAGCGLRGDNLLIKPFLGTAAPRGANGVLLLEIAVGIGLLLSTRLACTRTEATLLNSTSGPLKRSVDMAKQRRHSVATVNMST